MGHTFGAAGAIEAMMCVLAIRDGVLPPTINYEDPDPECDLDYVPNEARKADVRVALSNAMGLGGHNGCVILSRVELDRVGLQVVERVEHQIGSCERLLARRKAAVRDRHDAHARGGGREDAVVRVLDRGRARRDATSRRRAASR